MQYSFIQELLKRLQTSSPSFFKKLKWIAAIGAGAIMLFNYLISKGMVHLPNSQVWTDTLNTAQGIFIGIATGSMFTTTDAKLIDDTTKANVVKDVIENQPSEIINKL